MANKTQDYYPQEKGVIRRDRAGEFRDLMAKELMMESLGLIPVAGMAGKFMKPFSEYTSEIRHVLDRGTTALKGKRTTEKLAAESLKKESAKFKKDLLSGKVDALGKPQTEVGRSHLAKYGPHYTDAGVESRMGSPGVSASSYGGVMNLKDWTPVAVDKLKGEIKKNVKIYDEFVKGFKDLLGAKHQLNYQSSPLPHFLGKLKRSYMSKFRKVDARERLSEAKKQLLGEIIPTKHFKIKGVQEAFLKPAAKQARSELAKQFPKVPR